jgi:hypothetical protein
VTISRGLKRRGKTDEAKYWSRHLAGIEGATRIALPASAGEHRGLHRIRTRRLDRSEAVALNEVARRLRVTQSTFLTTVWALILRRYGHDRDVVFGVTTAGRPVDVKGIADAVGPFINTLPIRVSIDGNQHSKAWRVVSIKSCATAPPMNSSPLRMY